jgi:hypothetical protein
VTGRAGLGEEILPGIGEDGEREGEEKKDEGRFHG